MKHLFVALFFGLFNSFQSEDMLLCTDEFCEEYLKKTSCQDIPLGCTIQNGTHNGVFLPSSRPCNCCEFCLENLHEGDDCTIGDPSNPPPSHACGAGLYCKEKANSNDEFVCQPMDDSNTASPCAQKLWKYEQDLLSGSLGYLQPKPKCDRNGLYEPYICVPGEICFCVSKEGERIFGEIPFSSLSQSSLNCECSRNYHKGREIRNKDLLETQYFRCESNGDFDEIQCINDLCFCVNPVNGHPTHPEMALVNVTLVSASTMPCFNNKTHLEGEYYRECEYYFHKQLKVIKEHEEEGFESVGHELPNCQQDGRYGPVQKRNGNIKYCADPSGKRLENFEVTETDANLYSSMNCKCARARSIMSVNEKPECCKNGNYNSVQCRRGLCRCVDENGVQIATEVEYNKRHELSCFNQQCI